jgi:hypothetical protein
MWTQSLERAWIVLPLVEVISGDISLLKPHLGEGEPKHKTPDIFWRAVEARALGC